MHIKGALRASSARSLYELPAGPFAGSPATGRAEEAGGGSNPAPCKGPRHRVRCATQADSKADTQACRHVGMQTNMQVD